MNKNVFIFLNIVYFVFDYVCIPILYPEGVIFGFIPFQMFLYISMGVVSSLLWGFYYVTFLNTQHRYDDEGNIVRKEERK